MGPDLEISYFYLFLTFFLVLLNGFFVAAEFAMVRVRGSQIEIKAKTGSGVAKIPDTCGRVVGLRGRL